MSLNEIYEPFQEAKSWKSRGHRTAVSPSQWCCFFSVCWRGSCWSANVESDAESLPYVLLNRIGSIRSRIHLPRSRDLNSHAEADNYLARALSPAKVTW